MNGINDYKSMITKVLIRHLEICIMRETWEPGICQFMNRLDTS